MGKAPGSILHFVGGYLVGSQSKHKLLSYQKPIAITIFIIRKSPRIPHRGKRKRFSFIIEMEGGGGGLLKFKHRDFLYKR